MNQVLAPTGSTLGKGDFDHIVEAYRALFQDRDDKLAHYLDFDRQRPWSCLTSDFWNLDWAAVSTFNGEAAELLAAKGLSPQGLGERLRSLSLTHGVGYSLGFSPWTDDLLL